MTELSAEVRKQIIENKVTRYEQQAYDVTLDARVAERLNNDQMRQAAAKSLKDIEQALDVLREELAQVEAEAGNGGDGAEG